MQFRSTTRMATAVVSAALAVGLASGPASAQSNDDSKTAGTETTQQYANGETKLTDADRKVVNDSFEKMGLKPLPNEVDTLKTENDKIVALDAEGNEITLDKSMDEPKPGPITAQAGVGHEIKRVVGACLGIDFFAATSAWAAIESQVNDWDKAAKFVLRRVGLIAALSCGGGVFAEYLL